MPTATFPQSYIYQVVKEKKLDYKKGWGIFGWCTKSFVSSCKDLFASVLVPQIGFGGQHLMTWWQDNDLPNVFILTSFHVSKTDGLLLHCLIQTATGNSTVLHFCNPFICETWTHFLRPLSFSTPGWNVQSERPQPVNYMVCFSLPSAVSDTYSKYGVAGCNI